MLGAISGDIIGSVYEFNPAREFDFPLFTPGSRFTDDTVCSIAVADALLHHQDLAGTLVSYCHKYPDRGYGGMFFRWLLLPEAERKPYHSFGNGSAMRVSSVGWLYDSLAKTLAVAAQTAEITHNHPEGIKGAQAVAAAIYLARTGKHKEYIRAYLGKEFGYDLSRSYIELARDYHFDETCQGSVPEAIICFLDSHDFEDCIRKAVCLKGDADTQACIAGGIAEAFYGGVPEAIAAKVKKLLPKKLLEITNEIRFQK